MEGKGKGKRWEGREREGKRSSERRKEGKDNEIVNG